MMAPNGWPYVRNCPGTWIYREDVDEFTDAVRPWIEVVGSKDDAYDWEDPPYLGLSCGADFINLRTRFFRERIDVEFRFVPSDTVFESWHTSNAGSDTFLLPPAGHPVWGSVTRG